MLNLNSGGVVFVVRSSEASLVSPGAAMLEGGRKRERLFPH